MGFSKLIEISNGFLGPDHRLTLRTLTGLGDVALERGNYAEAEQLHRHVFELRRDEELTTQIRWEAWRKLPGCF